MDLIFLGCFVFGGVLTLASVVLGFGHNGDAGGHVDGGGHAEAGGDGGGHAAEHGHHDFNVLRLFNLTSITAGLTVFGAVGLVLSRLNVLAGLLLLVAAIAGGVLAAGGVGALLRLMRAGERTMDPDAYRLPGTLARVTVSIPEGGVGEIVYSKEGRRWSGAAREVNGRALPRETEVMIVEYVQGVALVQPWAEILGDGASGAAGSGSSAAS